MSEATITCDLQVEATQITWTQESIGSPIVNITQLIGDGSKYESTANRLTVKNLVAGDEGVYKCHYISASVPGSEDTDCVLILGEFTNIHVRIVRRIPFSDCSVTV